MELQNQIVKQVTALMSEIDDGEAALARARADLAVYRRALLKAAVTGELTADWRAANPPQETGAQLLARILTTRRTRWHADSKNKDKNYNEPSPVKLRGQPNLPKGWTWSSFEQLGFVSGGVTKNAKRDRLSLELPYLRVANVGAGTVDVDRIELIRVSQVEAERAMLEENDLLIVEGNGSIGQIGRSAVWEGRITPCVHQNHLIKVRFVNKQFAVWAQAWLMSVFGRADLEKQASSTSGLHTLSISKVQALACPIPPFDELKLALQLFDVLISNGNGFIKEFEQTRTASKVLRQSILSAAFRGELL